MRVTKAQLGEDIRALMGTLGPFGVRSSEQLAALLRDDDTYPSGAYVRLMLSSKEGPQPSERFCDRFYLLKEHVERSLAGDDPDLMLTLERVLIRDSYDPTGKLRFVTSGNGHLKPNEIVLVREQDGVPEGALVYVPAGFIGQCLECGAVFFKRSPVARYCRRECRREAARRRHREASREDQNAGAGVDLPAERKAPELTAELRDATSQIVRV